MYNSNLYYIHNEGLNFLVNHNLQIEISSLIWGVKVEVVYDIEEILHRPTIFNFDNNNFLMI